MRHTSYDTHFAVRMTRSRVKTYVHTLECREEMKDNSPTSSSYEIICICSVIILYIMYTYYYLYSFVICVRLEKQNYLLKYCGKY